MIIQQDSLEWLKQQEADSIDHIITDPPYLIDFMNKGWDSEDNVAGSVDYWKEALRVCKAGSYALVFGHSRTHHRVMVAMEDAGWEIRDCLMWIYGSGFPKSHNIGKKHSEWEGWGSALKPAYEPIIMARKPFKGSLVDNVLKNGLGGININACRVGTEVMPAITTKTETTEIGWEKKGYTTPEAVGRFPANIILSHNPDCRLVGETTETIVGGNKGKSGFVNGYESGDFTKKESSIELWNCEDGCPVNLINQQAPAVGNAYKATRKKKTTGGSGNSWTNGGKEEGEDNGVYDGLGGASRFFYCAKVSAKERNFGCEELETKQTTGGGGLTNVGDKFGSIKAAAKNHHPTIKPIKLMEWLVKLISKEGQIILDPFTGSGSTGIAVELLGRTFIGVEMDADYCDIAERRITAWIENENKNNPLQE